MIISSLSYVMPLGYFRLVSVKNITMIVDCTECDSTPLSTRLGVPETTRRPTLCTFHKFDYSPFPKSAEVTKFRYDVSFSLHSTPKLLNYLRKAVCLEYDVFLGQPFFQVVPLSSAPFFREKQPRPLTS